MNMYGYILYIIICLYMFIYIYIYSYIKNFLLKLETIIHRRSTLYCKIDARFESFNTCWGRGLIVVGVSATIYRVVIH